MRHFPRSGQKMHLLQKPPSWVSLQKKICILEEPAAFPSRSCFFFDWPSCKPNSFFPFKVLLGQLYVNLFFQSYLIFLLLPLQGIFSSLLEFIGIILRLRDEGSALSGIGKGLTLGLVSSNSSLPCSHPKEV